METGTEEEVAREVVTWRLEELVRAGYPEPDAELLAGRLEVDLHRACDLLRGNCPPELAMRILT